MRAEELLEQVPIVHRETTGAEAARVVAEFRLTGLVVADDQDAPIAVIPGTQLLSVVLPQYVRDDPKLAHAFDERAADDLCRKLNTVTIGELLDAKRLKAAQVPSVLPEDTLIEIATVMDQGHYPVVLVRERDQSYRGVVTMSRVLAAIATAAGQDSDLVRRRLQRDIIERGRSGVLTQPDPPEPAAAGASDAPVVGD
ncbi:CBS domain-containing protein [Nostocoides vanveenii]|jgi:CBS domain-containing protein|uniref:CBS domain-containing protein n=1 Tax=Nostocoides vanveenii TaxID=330835 RepID=A0ABP4WAE8_9MICO